MLFFVELVFVINLWFLAFLYADNSVMFVFHGFA